MSKPEAPEFQIERDYDARCAHARSMYHMAVQRAVTELDLALALADNIRQGELAGLRHAKPTLEDVAMVKRDLEQPYAVNRLTELPMTHSEAAYQKPGLS